MSPNTNVLVERSSNLALRANASTTASQLVNMGGSDVYFDLASVEVMSRSYADQLHKEIELAKQAGVNIHLLNMQELVQDVMAAVAKTQHNDPKEPQPYTERNFTFETMDEFYKLFDRKPSLV